MQGSPLDLINQIEREMFGGFGSMMGGAQNSFSRDPFMDSFFQRAGGSNSAEAAF